MPNRQVASDHSAMMTANTSTWSRCVRQRIARTAGEGAAASVIAVALVGSTPCRELGLLPLPLAGEGWGEGELALIPVHAPSLAPPPQAGEGTLWHWLCATATSVIA